MVRQTKKRWLAFLLAGVLSVSMLDTSAFALTAYASEMEEQGEPEGVTVVSTMEETEEASEEMTAKEESGNVSDEPALAEKPENTNVMAADEDAEVLAAASDNDEITLYCAVLLSDEEWENAMNGDFGEVAPERWMNADTIQGFFDREDDEWKGLWNTYHNLVIQPNSEDGQHDDRPRVEQADVIIPDGFTHVYIKNWAMMPFEFKGSITVPDNGTLVLEEGYIGDMNIKAGADTSVVLRRAEISGVLKTDSQTCKLTVKDGSSSVGGLEGFRDVKLENELYTTGKAEFWDLSTDSDTRNLVIEGDVYDEGRVPVFHKLPERVTDRPWILTGDEKQQLYEVKYVDEQNAENTWSDYYLSVSENGTKKYVGVWLEDSNDRNTARVESDAEKLTEAQAEERGLAAVEGKTVYVSKRYERYRYWNDIDDGNGGNEHREYEYVKIGEDLYRILANSGYEEQQEDSEEVKAAGTLAKSAASDVIADTPSALLTDLGEGYDGGQSYAPSLRIKWIQSRSDENNWEWIDVPLKEGNKVLKFAEDMDDAQIVRALEWNQFEFNTDYESDDTSYIRSNGSRYVISLDGGVYYEEALIYGVGGINEEDWNNRMSGDRNFESFDWIGDNEYPTLELALRALKGQGSKYGCLLIGKADMWRQFQSEVTVASLTVPDGMKGLSVMTRGYRVKGLESIEVPAETTLVLQEFFEGSEDEDDEGADMLEITGEGRLVLREAVLNANVEVKKTSEESSLDIRIFNDNAVKSLTSECLIDFDDGRLAVEDLFDTNAASITGRPQLAGRYDAVIRLGEINMMLDDTYGTDNLRVTSERKDGQNTKVEITSSDIRLGKVKDTYGISVSTNDGSYINQWYDRWEYRNWNEEEERDEQSEYLKVDDTYYSIDWEKERVLQRNEGGCPTLENAISVGFLSLVDSLPANAWERTWDASILIRVLDAEKGARFSTASIYDPNGWVNDPGYWDEENNQWVEGDYKKDTDWGGNSVHYTDTDDICLAIVTVEDLPFTDSAEDEELNNKLAASYGLIRGEFSSSEEGNEESADWTIQLECMAAHIPETTDEHNDDFYGKQVTGERVVNSYNMFRWIDGENVEPQDRISVDTHKYVAALTDLSGAQIDSIADQTETGSALSPAVTVKLGTATLIKDKDYTVEYKNNVKGGTATAEITGIAPFAGTKSINFTVKHVADDWTVTKAATQAETGTRVKKCKFCGEELESETIARLPAAETKTEDQIKTHTTHTPGEWTVEKEATAKEAGLKVRRCTECGEVVESEMLPKYTVSLNVKSLPLKVKQSTTVVKATVMDGDAVVKWQSSNTKVAAVTSKGKITGKKKGTATITVTTKKGATASVKITVQTKTVKVTKVTANVKKLTLKVKKSYKLTVTKTPLTASDKITYKTSNKKVATVDKNGKITAKKAGKATITIKCGSKKATVKVTVRK